jgi:hypothetical protein
MEYIMSQVLKGYSFLFNEGIHTTYKIMEEGDSITIDLTPLENAIEENFIKKLRKDSVIRSNVNNGITGFAILQNDAGNPGYEYCKILSENGCITDCENVSEISYFVSCIYKDSKIKEMQNKLESIKNRFENKYNYDMYNKYKSNNEPEINVDFINNLCKYNTKYILCDDKDNKDEEIKKLEATLSEANIFLVHFNKILDENVYNVDDDDDDTLPPKEKDKKPLELALELGLSLTTSDKKEVEEEKISLPLALGLSLTTSDKKEEKKKVKKEVEQEETVEKEVEQEETVEKEVEQEETVEKEVEQE